jgi:deoxyribonuclease-2
VSKYIDFRPLGVAYAWPETQDHAKWGITKKNNWVVVGDINRMITQRKRGGGAIALQDPKLWNGLKLTEFVDPPKGLTQEEATAILKSTADAERQRATKPRG